MVQVPKQQLQPSGKTGDQIWEHEQRAFPTMQQNRTSLFQQFELCPQGGF